MSVTISAAEVTCYVELVSMFFECHQRDPNEREERALVSVARMMLAGRERKSSLRRGRLLLEAAAALLHEARRMDEAREAREASLATDPVPAKVIH